MIPYTLVVPVYNEARRLDRDSWLAFVHAHSCAQLLFVDDGSTDDTAAMIESMRLESPRQIALRRLPENMGKAEAVRCGMLELLDDDTRLAGFIDADLAAPLSEVMPLVEELERFPEAWAAIGSRIKLLGRRIVRSERRHYLGRIFATCASVALGLPVYDTQCGLKMFRPHAATRAAFATPFRSRWIFDVELLARLARSAEGDVHRRIREVPLHDWQERGDSRLRLSDFVRAPLELARIRRDGKR